MRIDAPDEHGARGTSNPSWPPRSGRRGAWTRGIATSPRASTPTRVGEIVERSRRSPRLRCPARTATTRAAAGAAAAGGGGPGDAATAAMIAEEDHALRQQRMFLRDLVNASAVPQAVARFRIAGGRRSAPGVLQEGEGAHGPVHAAVEGGQRRVRHDGRVPQGRPPHRGGREDLLGRAGAGTTRGERGRVGRKRFRRRGGTQGCLPRARAGGYRPRARGPAGPEPRATMRRHREAQGRAGERRRRRPARACR